MPEYPYDLENARLQRGREVFEEERCGACHRVDDATAIAITPLAVDGQDRLPDDGDHPLGRVAIDQVLWDAHEERGQSGLDGASAARTLFTIRHGLQVNAAEGYRAADLRGMWATAPLLHNGSVDSLEALFTPPDERPTLLERGMFTLNTGSLGSNAGGHAFGTARSAPDRDALIAYLQSL